MSDFKQDTIAIVYDFDKTLSPKDMQNYGVFDQLSTNPTDFWESVHKERDETQAEELLIYMKRMIDQAEKRGSAFTSAIFKEHGSTIDFFEGVDTWFDRINEFVHTLFDGEVKLEHYVISSGLADMIRGCAIHDKFHKIYACEFIYENETGKPVWPARLVTDAAKTQYLFRINKGHLEPIDRGVNKHMPQDQRAIPFSNLMYIGDSDTDVPSMAVVMKNGGHSVAVYNPDLKEDEETQGRMKELKDAGRIDFYCEADYSQGSTLECLVLKTLQVIARRIILRKSISEL